MGVTKQICLGQANLGTVLTSSTKYIVEDINGNIYYFYNQPYTSFIEYIKSTDGGISWSRPIAITTTTVSFLSIWFDRWSGIAGGLIHIAYVDSAGHDVRYRNINTENSDALSSIVLIFDGVSSTAHGTLSITRTRGGNLICCGCIDAAAEIFTYKSVNVGANWSSIASPYEATLDQLIIMPGWATDNQDAMCFYWDDSATEISRKLYDDSANSWSETSIATSMPLNPVSASTSNPHFSATVDIANSQNILTAWSGINSVNGDLRCWKVTDAAITEVTNVVLNSLGKQGLCGISIDTDTQYWYAFYGGKSDGSGTWSTSVPVCYKISKDQGVTWSEEIVLPTHLNDLISLVVAPRFKNNFKTAYLLVSGGVYLMTYIYAHIDTPRANYILGI